MSDTGSSAALALGAARADLMGRHLGVKPGGPVREGLPQALAAAADRYFRERLIEAGIFRPGFSVVAVGGYGRSELCPGSDLDILLLYSDDVPSDAETAGRALFHPLWDLRLEVGHGVRSVDDCLALAASDMKVLASLLDARHLAGAPEPFRLLSARLPEILPGLALPFMDWLNGQNEMRLERHGDAAGLLAPDLKEGLGGLRDAHQIRWLQAVTGRARRHFTPGDMARLSGLETFLLNVRSLLHRRLGRKRDRLELELQPDVAADLGFVGRHGALAVETFLSRLHAAMADIKSMRRVAFRVARDAAQGGPGRDLGLTLDDTAGRPGVASYLDLFVRLAETGLPLAWKARREVAEASRRYALSLSGSEGLVDFLCQVMAAPNSREALTEMLETGFLGALLPEFGRVQDLVQWDGYHLHPLGRHSVESAATLWSLKQAEDVIAVRCWQAESDPRVLSLAALLHDIGKGKADHEERGARMVRGFLGRAGADDVLAAEVAFLVERHLLLPLTATRRDLGDEAVIARCAETVGSLARLRRLYLLSLADAMSTGPRAWNGWTAQLLRELFLKVEKLLSRGPLAEPHAAARMMQLRDRVRAQAAKAAAREPDIEARLSALPPRYLLAHDARSVELHIGLLRELDAAVAEDRKLMPGGRGGVGVVTIAAAPGNAPSTRLLSVAALRQPGLLATVAGALSLKGVNILSADIFTLQDGHVLLELTVCEPPDPLAAEHTWSDVRSFVRAALTGRLDMTYRLAQRRSSPLAAGAATHPAASASPEVLVDNEGSDFASLVQVNAADRLGRLHDLLAALDSLGLDVHAARIATEDGRVADIFSVREAGGGKLVGEERTGEVRRVLAETAKS